jgi:hypothetical protein
MTLPVSGAISFNAINVELGVAGTTTANINQASYRTLAGVPSGQISLSNFYGKSNRVALSVTYSSSTANASLNLSGIGGYIAGGSDITVTINGGVYLYATSTGNPGLNITGGTTGDTLTIVNNGFIMGQGGTGGGTPSLTYIAGTAGGPALSIPINATINNTNGSAYIGGGGGGGSFGGATGVSPPGANSGGGGGAGGGAGGTAARSNGSAAGGAGGGIGGTGSTGATNANGTTGGGGGGRIFPGTGGAAVSTSTAAIFGGNGGGAGGGGSVSFRKRATVSSGAGGSANNTGGSSSINGTASGGGGGWGASGGNGGNDVAGTFIVNASPGAGGRAVQLNGRTVTWVSGDTSRVYGAVS